MAKITRSRKQELNAIKDLVNGKKTKKPPRTRFLKQELNAIKDLVNGKKSTKPKPKRKSKPKNGGRQNA